MARRLRNRLGYFGMAACALGILIWARLLLVTRPPRVAIATPETPVQLSRPGQTQSDAPPSPEQPAAQAPNAPQPAPALSPAPGQ